MANPLYGQNKADDNLDQLGTALSSSATWNAGSIANGAAEAKDVTVAGAAFGDYVLASLSIDIEDLQLDAHVTASDTVTCVLSNSTGGAVNLASATVYVMVIQKK